MLSSQHAEYCWNSSWVVLGASSWIATAGAIQVSSGSNNARLNDRYALIVDWDISFWTSPCDYLFLSTRLIGVVVTNIMVYGWITHSVLILSFCLLQGCLHIISFFTLQITKCLAQYRGTLVSQSGLRNHNCDNSRWPLFLQIWKDYGSKSNTNFGVICDKTWDILEDELSVRHVAISVGVIQ